MIDRQRTTWVWVGYWVVAVGLRVLYARMADAVGTPAPAANLPAWWWFLAFLYFVVDVAFVLAAKFFLWTNSPREARKPFLLEGAPIVTVWLLIHMVILFSEYPVSSRLKSVGLSKLELLVFVALLTVCAAEILRLVATDSKIADDERGELSRLL